MKNTLVTKSIEERLDDILDNGLKHEPLVSKDHILNFAQECRIQEIEEQNKQNELKFKMWNFIVDLLFKSNSIIVDKLMGGAFPTEVKIGDLTVSFTKLEEVLGKHFTNDLLNELGNLKDDVFHGNIEFTLKLYNELKGE